jgi:hypothetical protein
MTEYRSVLERAGSNAPQANLPLERILQRRDRKRRNHRVAAGVIGVAAFILPAFGLVWLLGSEPGPVTVPATSPPSTVSPSTSPFTERFDSPLNGLSIGYPARWQTRAATVPWGHSGLAFGAPDVDVIFDPTLRGDLYFAVVSEPLGDTSGREWVSGVWTDLPSVGICNEPVSGSAGGSFVLDGADGYIESCGGDAVTGNTAIVATATRGYIIYLHVADERRLQATYDRDWFEAALETVDLRPEGAADASNTSESP